MSAMTTTECPGEVTEAVRPEDAPGFWPSRRHLFSAGALATALLASSRKEAQAQSDGEEYPTDTWLTPELRLARRITYGLNQDEVNLATTLGYNGYLEYHLNYQAIDDSDVDEFLKVNYRTLGASAYDLNWKYQRNDVLTQLQEATIFRSVYSRRQLFERMVEFWTDHFSIDINKAGILKTVDDREVIRKNALGNFFDMVKASAHSAAMLYYLDNTNSRIPTPNQNYARELMELHTLGVEGGYSQQDVTEFARCLSGWTMETDSNKKEYGTFKYNPQWHDNGEKIVLGTVIPAGGGQSDVDQVLDILLNHRSTARYISKKMIKWLLQYTPYDEIVERVADVYQNTQGDIKSMIREILYDTQLMAAEAKLKRPYHLVASGFRALDPTITSAGVLRGQLRNLGQMPFEWATPDGYPDKVSWWSGTVIQTWNFVLALSNNNYGGATVDVNPLVDIGTPEGIADAIDAAFFGGEMPKADKQALIDWIKPGPKDRQRLRDALGLALASPNFQYY